MGETRLFVVAKKDTVVQMREYLVRAKNPAHAQECVNQGFFICETEAETMELVDTETTACEEVRMDIFDDQAGSSPKNMRGAI